MNRLPSLILALAYLGILLGAVGFAALIVSSVLQMMCGRPEAGYWGAIGAMALLVLVRFWWWR